jgi:hypothetical protein
MKVKKNKKIISQKKWFFDVFSGSGVALAFLCVLRASARGIFSFRQTVDDARGPLLEWFQANVQNQTGLELGFQQSGAKQNRDAASGLDDLPGDLVWLHRETRTHSRAETRSAQSCESQTESCPPFHRNHRGTEKMVFRCDPAKSLMLARIFSPRSLRLCAPVGKKGIGLRLAALCSPRLPMNRSSRPVSTFKMKQEALREDSLKRPLTTSLLSDTFSLNGRRSVKAGRAGTTPLGWGPPRNRDARPTAPASIPGFYPL